MYQVLFTHTFYSVFLDVPYIFHFILGLAKRRFISKLGYDHILVRK